MESYPYSGEVMLSKPRIGADEARAPREEEEEKGERTGEANWKSSIMIHEHRSKQKKISWAWFLN